jgi:hypothetical protein
MSATSGRGYARFGFGMGISASIAGNVAHVFVQNQSPPLGAVISAGIWPVALFIALEVIARVSWPKGRIYLITRYGGLTTVACIAALLSYKHMSALLGAYGEDAISAALGPLVVDGLMIVCSAALLAISDNQKRSTNLVQPRLVYGGLDDD